MATCGDNHTLLLDVKGRIWFSGQRVGVGLDAADQDKVKEFTMLSSLSGNVPSEPMLYIATGQNHNLSLSSTGKVYAFGKNDYCKCGGRPEDAIVFFTEIKANDTNMSLIACGKRHSIVCDVKGLPYSWGNLTQGRLGLNPTNFSQKERHTMRTERPKEIRRFSDIFKRNLCYKKYDHKKRNIENAGKEEEEENKRTKETMNEQPKYPIQKKLKMELLETKEESLSRQFIILCEQLRDFVKKFAEHAKDLRSRMLKQHMQLANSVVSRIYSMYFFTVISLHQFGSVSNKDPATDINSATVPAKPAVQSTDL